MDRLARSAHARRTAPRPSFAARPWLQCLVAALLALLAAAAQGCGAPFDREGGDELSYELFPSTHVLTDDDLASLAPISSGDDDGTLRFASATPAVSALAPGDVILAGITPSAPRGLLRAVLSSARGADGSVVLATASAPLPLAFRRLHVRSRRTLEPFAQQAPFRAGDSTPLATSTSLRPRWTAASGATETSRTYSIVVFDGDGDTKTDDDQLVIDATLGGALRYDLSIDVDWGGVLDLPGAVKSCLASLTKIVVGEPPRCSVSDLLPEVKARFEAEPSLSVDVTAHGAASIGFHKDVDVGTIDLPPIVLGPLVFVPSADIVATIEGGASARFSASAHARVALSSKASVSSKNPTPSIDPVSLEDASASADTPRVDLFASVKASVGVRLDLSLYGVTGPYATARAVASLGADPLADPCWRLSLGIETELGARITSPHLPLLGYVTLIDWHTSPIHVLDRTIATGACESTEEGENPPGGGPDARSLQAPGFTPWATVLEGAVDGAAVADLSRLGQTFPFVGLAIDGRSVAGGGGARGLFKLDDAGALVWTSRLERAAEAGEALRSRGSVASADAGLVTLYDDGVDGFVVAKQGQSGAYELVRAFDLPADCGAVPALVANDRADGFVVAGSCRASGRAWLAHLDARLAPVRALTLADAAPSTLGVSPSVLVRAGGELVLAGDLIRAAQTSGEGDSMFVVRLDDDERPSAPAAFACAERAGLHPTAAAAFADGSVAIAGSATGSAFVTRLAKDDALGSAAFVEQGTGARDWFVPSAIADVPSLGLVLGLSAAKLGGAPPAVALVGLDGAGQARWAKQYVLAGASGPRAFAWPALRVTDDGGLLVTASAGPDGGASAGAGATPGQGALVAMKVFAKDGSLPAGGAVTTEDLAPARGSYAVAPRAFTPVVGEVTLTEVPFSRAP